MKKIWNTPVLEELDIKETAGNNGNGVGNNKNNYYHFNNNPSGSVPVGNAYGRYTSGIELS